MPEPSAVELQPPDPRILGPDVLGFDPALIRERALPCGQVACTPLVEGCVQLGTDPDQAVVAAGRQMAVTALTETVDRLQEEAETHKDLIATLRQEAAGLHDLVDELSIDRDTLTMTRNAMRILFARPEVVRVMEHMRQQKYTFMMIVCDADKLKTINALGGHDAGDLALAEQNARLRRIFRREYDVVGVLRAEAEAREAAQTGSGFDVVSRFERGDESIVLSFIPPRADVKDDERRPVDTTAIENLLEDGFRNAQVEFELLPSITEAELAEARASGLQFVVEHGPHMERMVHVGMSVTYAGVIYQVPTTEEFEGLATNVDGQLALLKAGRTRIETSGSITDLTARRRVRRRAAEEQR
jgi:GGDEF domain-containing protein